MNRLIIALLGLAALVTVGFVSRSGGPSEYRNATIGFTLQPPEFKAKASAPNRQVASFYAPPTSDGFAPNMNIQVQKWAKGLEAYIELSESQFDQAGFDVRESKEFDIGDRAAVRWMYTGRVQGRELQFLALAVERGEDVILLTCVAPMRVFKDHEPAFRKSLESFAFLKTE
jgi:hypothetical protein